MSIPTDKQEYRSDVQRLHHMAAALSTKSSVIGWFSRALCQQLMELEQRCSAAKHKKDFPTSQAWTELENIEAQVLRVERLSHLAFDNDPSRTRPLNENASSKDQEHLSAAYHHLLRDPVGSGLERLASPEEWETHLSLIEKHLNQLDALRLKHDKAGICRALNRIDQQWQYQSDLPHAHHTGLLAWVSGLKQQCFSRWRTP
jgi:hypothetical protein